SRISTTSEAAHVAAATSSISTGDVATAPSPSTRTGGRPEPPASNSSCSCHRMVISRVSPATSISSPRRQSHVQSVVAEATHPVVLQQPVERGPVVELEADHQVGPQVGTVGVGTAGLMSHQAESGPHVGRRRLFISREAIQRLETTDVAVAPVEEADLAGGADSEPGGDQIAGVEGDAEDHLRAAGEIDAAAHAEPEQPDVRAATARRSYRRRMELLGGERRDSARHEQHGQAHLPHHVSFPSVGVARVRAAARPRSEEHTSELQSRGHLVCRLLLEKKKKKKKKVAKHVTNTNIKL